MREKKYINCCGWPLAKRVNTFIIQLGLYLLWDGAQISRLDEDCQSHCLAWPIRVWVWNVLLNICHNIYFNLCVTLYIQATDMKLFNGSFHLLQVDRCPCNILSKNFGLGCWPTALDFVLNDSFYTR